MGYTHYYEGANKDNYLAALPTLQNIAERHNEILCLEWDEHPSVPKVDETGIYLNGIGEDGHETFVVHVGDEGWKFCKTAQKPYDIVVCEMLLVLEHYEVLTFSSDGGEVDWQEALDNVEKFYGIRSIHWNDRAAEEE